VSLDWGPGLRERVRGNLDAFRRTRSERAARRAAVAIVLLQDGRGEAVLPLFMRHPRLVRHAGQMGLPGGRLEEGEDEPAAARRELQEEVGISAAPDSVLGTLDDFPTRSGFVITPVVLWSEASTADLRPVPGGEIERLYVVSLRELARAVGEASPGPSADFFLPFALGNVYAPTAAILFQFSEVAVNGREVRVADYFQPPFTWR